MTVTSKMPGVLDLRSDGADAPVRSEPLPPSATRTGFDAFAFGEGVKGGADVVIEDRSHFALSLIPIGNESSTGEWQAALGGQALRNVAVTTRSPPTSSASRRGRCQADLPGPPSCSCPCRRRRWPTPSSFDLRDSMHEEGRHPAPFFVSARKQGGCRHGTFFIRARKGSAFTKPVMGSTTALLSALWLTPSLGIKKMVGRPTTP